MLPEQDLFFESLYRDNYEKLRIYAVAQLSDPFGAEEVVQDTFCTALNRMETIRQHENPAAYLKQVLKYKIQERRRADRRRVKIFSFLNSELQPEPAAPSTSIPTSVSGILQDAQNTLTEDEWYIMRRIIINGASHLEIAKELGITVWASQKRWERIREKLEAVLPEP